MKTTENKQEELLVLSFGSNLGDKQKTIEQAYLLIEQKTGPMVKVSSFYKTKPWGFSSKDWFLNSVACFLTRLSAEECLQIIHQIEACLGRTRDGSAGYSDRTIDIDILLYGDHIIESKDLIVPHPLLHKRDFVLYPLREILPETIIPGLNLKVSQITIR